MESETTIEFTQWYKDGSKVSIEFVEDDDDMNIYRFRDLCKRIAVAVGYCPNNVEEVFGESI